MQNHDPSQRGQRRAFPSTVQAKTSWPVAMCVRVRQQAKISFRKYSKTVDMQDLTAFITSSPEARIEGKIILAEDIQTTEILFETQFIFTCIRSRKNTGKIVWSMSLS